MYSSFKLNLCISSINWISNIELPKLITFTNVIQSIFVRYIYILHPLIYIIYIIYINIL